ncbi:hypothetical protein [Prosthecobacter sp.]|uniref:hypothetical protein n=1 Tax=Prosthecobacter sp. TaxID=1965333 RepID=UPI002487CD9E|nr:hypothetical protein [Prosthecobacter sp.]MDI1311902.1 hypothetical protein [Prosthecobacter sp.]
MKLGLIILLVAVMLGVGMFFGSQQILKPCDCANTTPMPVEHDSLLPELAWLRQSLHLTGEQFAKVQALHLAYQPKCAELCMRVHHSDQALMESSSRSRTVSGDVVTLMCARADLTLECQQAMLQHVYETAACMAPAQADYYLKIVLPHVLGPDHSRAAADHASH